MGRNFTKIRGLNLPGNPWATSACCGMTFTLLQDFQVRHSRCVDRITSIDKMRSDTTVNICIAKRCFYIACLNNTTGIEFQCFTVRFSIQ